ncbi:MAG: hypothetical protein WAZ12_03980 [Candidatus Absconditicoccaceae bacterium]
MRNVRYIMHTTPENNLDKIQQDGFLYKNGYPTVTASLPFVMSHALKQGYKEKPNTIGNLWKILIMKSPDDKIITTGYKGVIYIDEEKKEIHGDPRIWASARMQAGIYDTREIVQTMLPSRLYKLSKKEIKQFAIEKGFDRQKNLKQDTVAIISPTKTLSAIAWNIRKDIWILKKLDLYKYGNEIKKEIIKNKDNKIFDNISIDDVVNNILESTIQQEIINFIRNMFLIIKESQGYKIFKQDEQISIIARHKDSLQNLQLFKETVNHMTDGKYDFDITGMEHLQSLNTYIRMSINKLCKEID